MTMPQATSPGDSEQFGNSIRSYREARFLSLEELAARARLSPSYLSLGERGHRPPPPRGALGRPLEALEVAEGSAGGLAHSRTLQRCTGDRIGRALGRVGTHPIHSQPWKPVAAPIRQGSSSQDT